MEHKSSNGKSYEIGEIKEYRGNKTYDIVTIMDFEVEGMEIIGFYFGEYDYNVTEDYIKWNQDCKYQRRVD